MASIARSGFSGASYGPGVAMLLRRGWRIALLPTVPLAAAYTIWVAVSPNGSAPVSYTTQSVVQVVKFVVVGAADVFGRLGQLPGLAPIPQLPVE